MHKGKLLALVLMLLLALPLCAFAADYEVTLPDGYKTSGLNYPTIYVMPQDGYTADNSGLTGKLAGAQMIIVRPTLTKGADVNAVMADVIAAVDGKYRTIADKDHRAVIGTGVGGYLAYVTALADNSPFGAVASIRGNFVGEDNPWLKTCGNVMSRVKALYAKDKNYFNKIYTYMDAPVDDKWSNMAGSTNDMGSLFIGYGTGSEFHEYTVRPGVYDDAFLTESAERVLNRLQLKMYSSLFSGSVKPVKTVLTKADDKISLDYTINVSKKIATYGTGDIKMRVKVAILDDSGKIAGGSTSVTVSGAGKYTGRIVVDNVLKEDSSDVELTAEVMGAELELGSASVVLLTDPVAEGNIQQLNLMGDWYFNYVGSKKTIDVSKLTKAEYTTWSVAQPGFSNWTKGYGNISDKNVTSFYGPDYFDYFITGSGYYAKNFTVPKNFTADKFVLSIGYVDDRCEVFLNGKRIGATGMDANGKPTGDTTWAVYSHFDVDASQLNIGGENTVVVRAWNDTPLGAGGWYGGPIGLYSEAAFEKANSGADSARFYEETYTSKALGKDMEYLIYLPKNYEKGNRFYPTVYLLHQFNSDHTSYRTDKVNELFDEAIAKGMFDEMIVVIPNSDPNSWWKDKWEKMVTEDLIPHIEKNYRAIPDARYRLTAGCSMGGQGAMGVALTNPNLFSGAVSFFGAFSYGGKLSPNSIAKEVSDEFLDYYSLYFICGNQDSYKFGSSTIELNQQLQKRGIEHFFFIENGGHDSTFYIPNFQEAFEYTRANMYKMPEGDLNELIAANYAIDSQTGDVLVEINAGNALRSYFLNVPDSKYTTDTTPGITIPVVVNMLTEGGNARSGRTMQTKIIHVTFDENNMRAVERVTPDNGATVINVTLDAQLLGGNNVGKDGIVNLEIDEEPNLPQTGDNSNIMLLCAMLMASVAGIVVMGRKKVSC